MLDEAAKSEVLSARALDYRKIVLGLSVTLLAIGVLGGAIRFDKLSLFGLEADNKANSKTLVLTILWLLLAYHAMMFFYYAWRDFSGWKGRATVTSPKHDFHISDGPVTSAPYFPELQMFLNRPPSAATTTGFIDGKTPGLTGWEEETDGGQRRWKIEFRSQNRPNTISFNIPLRLYLEVRRRLVWFAFNDVGVVMLLVAATIAQHLCGWPRFG